MIDGALPNRPLRGALVGYGFIAENGHLPAYAALSESPTAPRIVAIADSCPARQRAAARAYPGVHIYSTHGELLDAEADRIDFVDVTTPPSEHARIAHDALSRGLHVLCEKPITTDVADARSLLAHARRAGRVFFPCHNYKHAPVIRAVRRVLDDGRIGDVNLITLQTFRTTHAKGVADWRPNWRRERRWSGGGIAMDHGSHTFYLAFDWFGAHPTAITAKTSTIGNYDTEDNLACALTFPNGTASAQLSWTAGVRKVIYTIHGHRGAIRVEDDDVEVREQMVAADGRYLEKRTTESVSSNWMDAGHSVWFRTLLGEFTAAIATRDFAGAEAQDAVRCIELITTAYESAHEGSHELRLGSAA